MPFSMLDINDSEEFNSENAAETLAAILPRVLQRHGLEAALSTGLPAEGRSHIAPFRDTVPRDAQSSRGPSGCSKYRVKLRTRCT